MKATKVANAAVTFQQSPVVITAEYKKVAAVKAPRTLSLEEVNLQHAIDAMKECIKAAAAARGVDPMALSFPLSAAPMHAIEAAYKKGVHAVEVDGVKTYEKDVTLALLRREFDISYRQWKDGTMGIAGTEVALFSLKAPRVRVNRVIPSAAAFIAAFESIHGGLQSAVAAPVAVSKEAVSK